MASATFSRPRHAQTHPFMGLSEASKIIEAKIEEHLWGSAKRKLNIQQSKSAIHLTLHFMQHPGVSYAGAMLQ
jgi:hypothetical protein